jgi:thiosulfate/3-mercaptopyruvate sulfurtransferase
VVTALAVRSRPSSVEPRALPPDRNFPATDLLVAPAELSSLPARLLDASDLADFRGEHIPGARHVWWQDTMELNSLWYGTVLKPDDGQSDQTRRQQLLDRWQVHAELPVVVYDRDDGSRAARVAWFLRFLSVPARVLDGGFAAWIALDETARAVVPLSSANPTALSRPREGFYLDVLETAETLGQPDAQVIDIRTDRERSDGALAGLSAPGAAWLARDALIDESGLIVPPADLTMVITRPGVDLTRRLTLVGDTGPDTSVPWLALSLMGAASVTICDGGWQQWADTPELPTAPV